MVRRKMAEAATAEAVRREMHGASPAPTAVRADELRGRGFDG
jgi:hypothetical protein